MESESTDSILSSYLKKKKSKINAWSDRFVILRSQCIDYFVKAPANEFKGTFPLSHNCRVSSISVDSYKKSKLYVFSVTCLVDDDSDDKNEREPLSEPSSPKDKTRSKRKGGGDGVGAKVAAAAVGGVVLGALTAGVGLLAGMVVVGMGAAAGGTAAALSNSGENKEKTIIFASSNYEEAERWVSAIESQVQDLADHVLGVQLPRSIRYNSTKRCPFPDRMQEVEDWLISTKWKVFEVYEGIRMLEPVKSSEVDQLTYDTLISSQNSKQMEISTLPCLRVNICINSSADSVFQKIFNISPEMKSGIIHSMKIIKIIDETTDIVHLKLNPVFLYPTWTAPRDFCLIRYWSVDANESRVLCLDSTTHDDCPLSEGYVRGELHAAYVIANIRSKRSDGYPKEAEEFEDDSNECLLSLIAQMDPKGWIWSNLGYQKQFLREFMLQALDIRDTFEADRFVQFQFDPITDSSISPENKEQNETLDINIANTPPPALATHFWAPSDASIFKVRSATYNSDKVKCNSAPSLFKLIAVDLFEVQDPISNIASHPKNRVHLAAQRGDPSWIFIVNIMVPGPPNLSFVAYFLADKTLIDADTPFGRIARPFFYGNDDEFRNNRFKLIPKIIEGNMIIKMAVKDTPALIGNKLKSYYFKGDNYFELDVDVGSSSVARNVTGLAMGYSKAIVVDMGFCLQGNDEDELPEVLMGGCTCIHVDASTAKKL